MLLGISPAWAILCIPTLFPHMAQDVEKLQIHSQLVLCMITFPQGKRMGQSVMGLSKHLPLGLTAGRQPWHADFAEDAVCVSLGKRQPCATQNEPFLVTDKPGHC